MTIDATLQHDQLVTRLTSQIKIVCTTRQHSNLIATSATKKNMPRYEECKLIDNRTRHSRHLNSLINTVRSHHSSTSLSILCTQITNEPD